jgi:cytochrome c oxidase subunit 3
VTLPTPDERRTPIESREPSFRMSTAQMGMLVLFASLSVLFCASLVAHGITRAQSELWNRGGVPGLWLGLGAVSLVLAGISVAMHVALRAVRKNRFGAVTRSLAAAAGLVTAFLVLQSENWRRVAEVELVTRPESLYAVTFYLLTVLHALHVAAGIVPLLVLLVRSRRREYTSSRHDGVRFCVQYWDFLLVVWAILLVALAV